MCANRLTVPPLKVRTKILLLFLALALVSLAVTSYVALQVIGDVSRSAGSSSLDLGRQALDDSSVALQASAEDNLITTAADQAAITNVLFDDAETELDLLSVQAATLADNPPIRPRIPSASMTSASAPANTFAATAYTLVPDATVTTESPEFTTLAGMDDLLAGLYHADSNLTSVYVATDSGILRVYPWQDLEGSGFDPRTRVWYSGALQTRGVYWSEPYVDRAGHGLIVTTAKSVQTRYGPWVIASDVSVDEINTGYLNTTLNGKGYAVLIDSNGTIISRPGLSAANASWDQPFDCENIFTIGDPSLAALGRNMTAGKTGLETVQFGGRDVYVAYAPITSLNWSYAVSMPVSVVTAPVDATRKKILESTVETEIQISRQTGHLVTVFSVLIIILLLIVAALAVYLSRVITRPVDTLRKAALALGHGDLSYRVEIHTGDEFEDLAKSFNRMAEDLRQSIDDLRRTTAEKERYTKELEIAREIQDTFLPEAVPSLPGFSISAMTIPAMEIGGDLYDFIPAHNGKWGFVIADVSGKGVSAALFMALCRTLLHASGSEETDPSAAIRRANAQIYEDGRSSMFITVFYGVLDPRQMNFSYVNAGHNPPLLVRGDAAVASPLAGQGIALGVVEEVDIPVSTLALQQNDILVLYTDGVTEAFNAHDEYFGEERLIASVIKNRSRPVAEIADALLSDIREFCGGAPQSDDITLVIIRAG